MQTMTAEFSKRGITMRGEFTTVNDKYTFDCKCGFNWVTTFSNVSSGKGCARCPKRILTEQDIKIRFQHFYDRDIEIIELYKGKTSTLHRCRCLKSDCNHQWSASINNLSNGRSCPKCSKNGFNPGKPAIFYYLKFTVDYYNYYKIGITNRSIKSRFNREPLPYKILLSEQFNLGKDAKNKESELIALYKNFIYKGDPILSSGNTELFCIDILGLD